MPESKKRKLPLNSDVIFHALIRRAAQISANQQESIESLRQALKSESISVGDKARILERLQRSLETKTKIEDTIHVILNGNATGIDKKLH